ncbi:hypothetical protein C2845_PM03G25030 [Panicum miliaceum]|uniref:Ethylene insensitive 3-like DNA-binding domain-containing protein n=1 Tax=Panicum miliaceum TaxID=4540 RepID=A0A3L6T529_PANMI|nr:hypothetical protein C2845_PM03G25030 [Panicum miliaceum]
MRSFWLSHRLIWMTIRPDNPLGLASPDDPSDPGPSPSAPCPALALGSSDDEPALHTLDGVVALALEVDGKTPEPGAPPRRSAPIQGPHRRPRVRPRPRIRTPRTRRDAAAARPRELAVEVSRAAGFETRSPPSLPTTHEEFRDTCATNVMEEERKSRLVNGLRGHAKKRRISSMLCDKLGGVVASAAYKKWERAAMAGVSLVADAAKELERNTINPGMLRNVDARTLISSSDKLSTVDGISTNQMKEAYSQAPVKLKMQLFPINEAERKALEKEQNGEIAEWQPARNAYQAMAGQYFRHLGASSSTRARQQEEIKRKQDAAAREEEAKRQRHSHHSHLNVAARPTSGAAVRVVPLHHAAGNNAMAVAFPVAGVNGAAQLRWMPAMTGVSNAPAPPPFVLAPPVLLQVIGHAAMAGAIAPPAPAFGMPLAAALDKLKNDALGSMLSALMPACNPPVEQRLGWARPPPPWWPTASEDWWAPELVAHLFTMPVHTPVPFAPAYKLKKAQKVAVLVAIVKHHAPDLDKMSSKAMCDKANLWKSALWNEPARCKANLSVPRPRRCSTSSYCSRRTGDGRRQAASCACATATTEKAVRSGGIAAAIGANLAGASVAAPAAGRGGLVVAAAEPEQRREQHSNGVVHGGVLASWPLMV